MPYRIALFERSPQLQYLVSTTLLRRGFEVIVYPEPPATADDIWHANADLVIIGNTRYAEVLPEVILNDLRACTQARSLPVVFWTTEFNALVQAESVQKDTYVEIIPKPVAMSALIDCVQRLLQRVLG